MRLCGSKRNRSTRQAGGICLAERAAAILAVAAVLPTAAILFGNIVHALGLQDSAEGTEVLVSPFLPPAILGANAFFD